jgi:hypothetical protein
MTTLNVILVTDLLVAGLSTDNSLDTSTAEKQIDGQQTSDNETVVLNWKTSNATSDNGNITTGDVMSEVQTNANDTLLWPTTAVFNESEHANGTVAPSIEWRSMGFSGGA